MSMSISIRFLSIFLDTLGATLLGNRLRGKGVIQAGKGTN